MSDMGFRVFPSGFAMHDSVYNQTQAISGDVEVAELFKLYMHGRGKPTDFDYFMKVILAAKRLLGVDPNWLMTQIYNPNLNRYKVEFVTDTVIYLTTGRRSQTLTTWRALCCDDPVTAPKSISLKGHPVNKQIVLPKDMLFSHPAQIISTWLSQPSGFVDLVESLHLMFGEQVSV